MSEGEMMYLGFVLVAFAAFAAVLAVISNVASGNK